MSQAQLKQRYRTKRDTEMGPSEEVLERAMMDAMATAKDYDMSPEKWGKEIPWWFWPLVVARGALPFRRGIGRIAGKLIVGSGRRKPPKPRKPPKGHGDDDYQDWPREPQDATEVVGSILGGAAIGLGHLAKQVKKILRRSEKR